MGINTVLGHIPIYYYDFFYAQLKFGRPVINMENAFEIHLAWASSMNTAFGSGTYAVPRTAVAQWGGLGVTKLTPPTHHTWWY